MYIGRKESVLGFQNILKILYMIILVCFIIVFITLFEITWKNGDKGQFAALVISEIFIIYGGILLRRLWRSSKKDSELEEDIRVLKQKSQWEKYYKNILESKRKISYIRHDIANHVQVIQAMSEKYNCKYSKEALVEVQEELERLSAVKYCDNLLFDMALEQRIRNLKSRGITVITDIKLTGIENIESDQLCLTFWLIIDSISEQLRENGEININIYNHINTSNCIMIAWNIEADGEMISEKDSKLLKFLLDRLHGSLIIDKVDGKTRVTGMMEVKIANVE